MRKNEMGCAVVVVAAVLVAVTFVLLGYEAAYFSQYNFLRKAGW